MTITHTSTDEIVCPWCGHKWLPDKNTLYEWEEWGCYLPDPCAKCGKPYEVEMQVERIYTTTKVKEKP